MIVSKQGAENDENNGTGRADPVGSGEERTRRLRLIRRYYSTKQKNQSNEQESSP